MLAVELLAATSKSKQDEVVAVMAGNFCRCGCYQRIARCESRSRRRRYRITTMLDIDRIPPATVANVSRRFVLDGMAP
jgi:xanthine dehydrogenase iron-sulfur cluster and FAD-binding subunit A